VCVCVFVYVCVFAKQKKKRKKESPCQRGRIRACLSSKEKGEKNRKKKRHLAREVEYLFAQSKICYDHLALYVNIYVYI
jgi:hypothetical protein